MNKENIIVIQITDFMLIERERDEIVKPLIEMKLRMPTALTSMGI